MNMMKRLMSLLLCLVMLVAALPLCVQAEEEPVPEGYTRVYCMAPASWSACKLYWWGRSNFNPAWPGVDMMCNSDGIWTYDVPSDVVGLVFNDGSGHQSADLQLPTDENNMFVFMDGKWAAYGTAEPAYEFYVAGLATLCGVEWVPDAPENKMQDEDQDGIYTITYTNVAAGTYEFKITNGTWDHSWGLDGGVDNYQLVVTEDQTDLEIRFDSASCRISVEILKDAPVDETAGAFMNITVQASKMEVQVGDTVDFTVYAYGEGITAMQFNLIIPQGMTYVSGSGAVPANLQNDLGWGALDWTEDTLMWTGYNDLVTAFAENTPILTFSCVAEEPGSHKIRMYEPLAFDGNFEEKTVDVTVDQVEVSEKTADPVVIPTLALKAPTLEFKDMITVNAMFTAENIENVVEMGMITYSSKVDSWSVETAEHVIPGTTYDESTGRYIAASQGIHAKYLGDAVYLACYAKLTDGSYVYTKLASYSPVQYATSKLSGTDTKLKQLVVAMLNYGAAAQVHFGHNVENLANGTLTSEQIALPESYRSDMVSTVASPSADKQGTFANNQGFAKRYPSISFEGAFCINYFFTPNYAPVDGITLYYWNAADYEATDVLTVENASGFLTMDGTGTGEYRGDITGIAAKALSEGVYVAAVYSDGTTTWTSGVLGYSIGAYCASQSTKGGTIADLAMATAVYGYQAKTYFG